MVNMLFHTYMFMMFLLLNLMSMIYYYLDLMVILEWNMLSVSSLNIEFIMLFDWISLLFISFILLISSMVMLYSKIYMSGDKFVSRFNYLLVLFIFSMILMVISPNVISILFGWDSLGVTSYCLVMYYQNYMSYNSAMVTVLCNRLGDIGILMSISLLMMSGSWNLMMINESSMILMFMMMVASITKSAQIPFSVWLPLAMAAPTPVSALVHSSTLVTAGIYLMIRFSKYLMSSGISMILVFLSVVTMFMAGMMANFENDLKKIIALSTLSQLGLMMMILGLGFKMMAFYHLLIHAIFKSMLFMGAGVVIHLLKNNQDIRMLGNLNEFIPFTMMSLLISNMALSGVPFMSGFYSKDLIMELIYSESVNLYMYILILMSLVMTVSYSFRFFYYLFFNFSVKFFSCMCIKEDSLFNCSMMIMMLFSVSLGSIMNWIFFFDYYLIYLPLMMKLMTLMCCLMGLVISSLIMNMSKFIELYWYMSFYSSMWFLNSVYSWVYAPSNLVSVGMNMLDKGWLEFLGKYFIFHFLIKELSKMFKFYMCMFVIVYLILLMYLCY